MPRRPVDPERHEAHKASRRTDEYRASRREYDRSRQASLSPKRKADVAGSVRRWRHKYPERHKEALRNCTLKRKYGIDAAAYDAMHTAQRGLCAICGRPELGVSRTGEGTKRLAVDHCHATKKIRGLLCEGCNRAIGLFREDVTSMARAIEYLREHAASEYQSEGK